MEGHYSVHHSGGGVQDLHLPRAGEREVKTDFLGSILLVFHFKERQKVMFNTKEKCLMVRFQATAAFFKIQ